MPSLALYRNIPWFAKLAAKIVLSRVPFPHELWHRLGLFRHGRMRDVHYAYRVFRRHFDRSGLAGTRRPFTMLELGPGDSLLSAVFARAHGASRSVLVDVSACACRDASIYRQARELLVAEGLNTAFLDRADDWTSALEQCRAEYHYAGLASLKSLASGSIDFIWSQAVLEHVRLNEFAETQHELRRILKPGGLASHRVDLRDHLGGALNNLRFRQERWESPLFANSGFYTNRIRYREMLEQFEEAGFAVQAVNADRWTALPTRREAMHAAFQLLPTDDLRVQGFDVVLRPRAFNLAHAA